MINNHNRRTTAIDIYKNGYQTKFIDRKCNDVKRFFLEVRGAVIEELLEMGYCDLLDSILERKIGRIDVVAFAAFSDIAERFESNTLTDTEECKDFVPYVHDGMGGGIPWSRCEYGKTIVMAEKHLDLVRKARDTLRLQHVKKTTREYDEKILTQARFEADKIKENANNMSKKIIEDAEAKAKAIIDDVNKKENAAAKEKAEKLIAHHLAEEQRAYKAELNDEMRKFTDSSIENSSRVMTIYTEMCDTTNAIQAKWIQALDDTLSKMSEIKSEFYSHLHDWQVSLFPKEIKPLAERFLELYRILNVDKLLREEILLETTLEKKNDVIDDLENDKIDAREIRIHGLQKLNKTLNTFLRRFELSLNGLDLYVYYPNSGDVFDEMWHIQDDEDEEYIGKRIKECVVPGIAKKANDDFGDDVLIPAVVKVETES